MSSRAARVLAGRDDRHPRLLELRPGGLQAGLARLHRRGEIARVDLQQELARVDAVAFLDRELGDPPMLSALMLTERFGWILPEAETIDSRSRAWMASTVTSLPVVSLNAKLAYARPRHDGQHPTQIDSLVARFIFPPGRLTAAMRDSR